MSDGEKFPEPASIFRTEALKARGTSELGTIILVRPVSISVMISLISVMLLVVLAFIIFGSYARRTSVEGVISPAGGIVRIFSPQVGVIQQRHVTDGDRVKRGDLLFTISSDRLMAGTEGSQSAISAQVRRRRESLLDEVSKIRVVHTEEISALADKIVGLEAESSKVRDQLTGQRARVALADLAVGRSRQLVNQHFISSEQLDVKAIDLLEQRNRLQELERIELGLSRELAAQRSVHQILPMRHASAVAAITRTIDSATQELFESDAKRGVEIRATQDGRVTLSISDIGQFVDQSKLLTVIVPEGSKLIAYLYVPSRAIAFIKPGDTVKLRIGAYPYQKFGDLTAAVVNVSNTALPSSEFAGGFLRSPKDASEPLFQIKVSLGNQALLYKGTELPLQPGMTLTGEIILEKRRIIEWILEPLFGLTQNIF